MKHQDATREIDILIKCADLQTFRDVCGFVSASLANAEQLAKMIPKELAILSPSYPQGIARNTQPEGRSMSEANSKETTEARPIQPLPEEKFKNQVMRKIVHGKDKKLYESVRDMFSFAEKKLIDEKLSIQ